MYSISSKDMISNKKNNSKPLVLFIIGGQRCGTTFLLELFRGRPNTLILNRQGKPEPRSIMAQDFPKTAGEYIRRLDFNSSARKLELVIEKSTSYYESQLALTRFEHGFGMCNFVVVLRDPVERAISNYFFSKAHGIETRTISEAFADPPLARPKKISVNPYDYLLRSQYERLLGPWVNSNLRQQLYFLRYDDLVNQPKSSLVKILHFLGCEGDITYLEGSTLTRPVNSSLEPIDYDEAAKEVPDFIMSKLIRERVWMESLFEST